LEAVSLLERARDFVIPLVLWWIISDLSCELAAVTEDDEPRCRLSEFALEMFLKVDWGLRQRNRAPKSWELIVSRRKEIDAKSSWFSLAKYACSWSLWTD
jgi:hypothetical protein